MNTVKVGNYEVGLSKVSNGDQKEDEQIKRNVGRTEVFSLEGHFTKVSEGPKVYFKIDIGGGVGSRVVGRWVDLKKVGDKVTKLFCELSRFFRISFAKLVRYLFADNLSCLLI